MMSKPILACLGVAAYCAVASAVAPPREQPRATPHKGPRYGAPHHKPTQTSAYTTGATVGVERRDGSGAYIGTDTSTPRPTYSLGASTGGNVSLTGGVSSDGKANNGVKAGVTIKY